MKKQVSAADCYRALDEMLAKFKTEDEKRDYVQRLKARFALRYKQKLQAALSQPVPDLNEVRHWNIAIKEMA